MKLKHILFIASATALLPVQAQQKWDLRQCIDHAIANNLNGRGIPTKTGKTWAPATIHLLLKRSSLVAAI